MMTLGTERAHRAEERLAWAADQLRCCRLCPRNCGVNRAEGEVGICGVDARAHLYDAYVHYGEEAGLSPSYAVFLTGCNIDCLFCYTVPERCTAQNRALDAALFAQLVADANASAARNLNIYGGEPTVNLPALLEMFAGTDTDLPFVFNTNSYINREPLRMLQGIADCYLMDLKFANSACSESLASAGDYWEQASSRVLEVFRYSPESLIVRHMALPGHYECCSRPALEWVARNLPGVRFNLLLNYTVVPRARGDGKLGRFLDEEEKEKLQQLARELGLNLIEHGEVTPESIAQVLAATGVEGMQAEQGNGGSGRKEKREQVEIIIGPDGQIHLKHPTRSLLKLVEGAFADCEERREK